MSPCPTTREFHKLVLGLTEQALIANYLYRRQPVSEAVGTHTGMWVL